jgi:hypothetical protein
MDPVEITMTKKTIREQVDPLNLLGLHPPKPKANSKARDTFEAWMGGLMLIAIGVAAFIYWPWDSTRDHRYHECMMQPGVRMEQLIHCMAVIDYSIKRDCRAPFGADAMSECFYVKHWWSELGKKEEKTFTPTAKIQPTQRMF